MKTLMPLATPSPSECSRLDPTIPSPALWADNPEGWERQMLAQAAEAHRLQPKVVFLGDSITQGWGAEGREEWTARFASLPSVILGIGGDRTQNLLWRITASGALDGLAPRLAVVLIGVNNLWRDVEACGAARVAEGIKAVVMAARHAYPGIQVLALGVLPTQSEPTHPLRAVVNEVNTWCAALLPTPDGTVHFMDIGDLFLETDGTLSPEIMHDACHLTPLGYRRFADAIEPLVRQLLGANDD